MRLFILSTMAKTNNNTFEYKWDDLLIPNWVVLYDEEPDFFVGDLKVQTRRHARLFSRHSGCNKNTVFYYVLGFMAVYLEDKPLPLNTVMANLKNLLNHHARMSSDIREEGKHGFLHTNTEPRV